jgi:hypothetical protein
VIDALKPLETALPAGNVLNAMAEAVRQAGQAVRDLAAADRGTGTTLTAMLWSGSQLALVHVGDTRAYVLREGRAGQHSLRGRRRHRRSGRLMEAPSCWPTATLVSFMEQAVEAMAGRDWKRPCDSTRRGAADVSWCYGGRTPGPAFAHSWIASAIASLAHGHRLYASRNCVKARPLPRRHRS